VSEILVFHVQLLEISPPVWRRLAVRAEGTFWHLHCAIQDAMPWDDKHLHEFRFPTGDAQTRIGIAGEADFDDDEAILASWETPLTDWFTGVAARGLYLYDFGDGWEHSIVLEARLPAVPRGRYPQCLAGERRCPPEDVGGPRGYGGFLAAVSNPQANREWVGGSWNPEQFRPEDVTFSSPSARLRRAGLS
jgi:Plasmid pRiA4b ORF-3-like protein